MNKWLLCGAELWERQRMFPVRYGDGIDVLGGKPRPRGYLHEDQLRPEDWENDDD